MPRSYRYFIAAAGGWLVLAGAVSNNTHFPDKRAERQQSDAQDHIAKTAKQLAVTFHQPQQAVPDDGGCPKGEDNRKSDLCAQWKAADAAEDSANWAARAFWLGGIGTALLLWTLLYTARGTRAATQAVEMQINSDRPLVQLTDVKYWDFDPFGDKVRFRFGYEYENLGSTGCWIESVSVGTYTNTKETPDKRETHAFLAPGKGLTTIPAALIYQFTDEETEEFSVNPHLMCIGSVVYRNASGIRWETGFAVKSNIDGGKSSNFNPMPNVDLWFDRRLPSDKSRRWYKKAKK